MGDVSESLEEPESSAVGRVTARARQIVPEAEEGAGYGMPALRYRCSPLPDEVVDRLVRLRRGEIDAVRS